MSTTYVLIHGAWHGGWCWRKIVPLLEAGGHRVFAPDLPGHGDDKTATATVTLESYTDRICEIACAQTEQVILVGHSMGASPLRKPLKIATNELERLYICPLLAVQRRIADDLGLTG